MYPPELVAPMKQDLTDFGFEQLLNSQDVINAIKNDGTTLVVVNSVCGCAAGNARPGVKLAVQNS
ncbi:MAG TPA: BrxA/BrxB family bacilliredoxin, partial [Bacteroidetes bacterium]|nr:BrxA/BrxB family bacilliredoxin [Bacteroidota bacterium]